MKNPNQLEFAFEPIAIPAARVVRNLGRRLYSERYRHHLSSDAWRATRRRLIAQAQNRCARCGCLVTYLEIHHRHYKTLGNERDHDLEVLCEPCHEKADEERRAWTNL